jgi:alkylated DNA repair dioxygenase AlkB
MEQLQLTVGLGNGSQYLPGFLPQVDQVWMQAQQIDFLPRSLIPVTMYGKKVELPRDKQFFALHQNGNYPYYRYTGSEHDPVPLEYPPWLNEIRLRIEKVVGHQLNHSVVSRYRDGSDYIGDHQDKTGSLAEGSTIAIISLGAPRRFVLKHKTTKVKEELTLLPGSLLCLDWNDNLTHVHSIPKTARPCGERISVTFRMVTEMRPLPT